MTEHHQVETFLSSRASGPSIYNCAVLIRPSEPEASDSGEHNDGQRVQDEGRIIGILGSHTYPEVGYLFHPDHQGKGYATEALQAFVPQLFARMPSPSISLCPTSSGEGEVSAPGDSEELLAFDFAQAHVDIGNIASQRLLERCGWSRAEVTPAAYTSPQLGVRDDVCFRIARPGMRLEDVMEKIKKTEGGSEGEQEAEGAFVPDLM